MADDKLLLGVNTFYDQEFPYRHGRASLGLEARTTVGEVTLIGIGQQLAGKQVTMT